MALAAVTGTLLLQNTAAHCEGPNRPDGHWNVQYQCLPPKFLSHWSYHQLSLLANKTQACLKCQMAFRGFRVTLLQLLFLTCKCITLNDSS